MSVDCKHATGDPGAPAITASLPQKSKRVLVVSYDFPPNRTSAVYRMTGLTKYLSQFGWEPTVLTIRAGEGEQEPKLLEKLPAEVEVVRTEFLRINAWEKPAATAIAEAGGLQAPADRRERQSDRFLRALARLVRSTLY